jgi:WD40 repeat protein
MKCAASFGESNSFSLLSRQLVLGGLALLVATGLVLLTGLMLPGCSGGEKTVAPRNLPPSINAIQLVPPRAAPGDTVVASAIAGDPEGKPLVFLWRASVGTLIDSLGQSIRWIAPSVASTCSLTVKISDEANEVSMSRVISVGVGCLVIESFPEGARLLIDSEPTELFTPLTIADAPVGSYSLQVERAPYVYSPNPASVEVTHGDTTRVRFKLNEGVMSMTQMTVNGCVTQSSWSPSGASVVCAIEDLGLGYRALAIFDSPWPDFVEDVIQTGTGGRQSWGPSWCPTTCAVLFASSRTGVNRIYQVPICGYPYGGEAQLVYSEVANFPVWSPSGDRIAFLADESGSFSLKIMPGSGGPATTIAAEIAEDRPSWSPDGSQVVFSKIVDGQPYLFAVPSGGGTPLQISQVPGMHPSWSPSGNMIAFVSSLDGTENVWILFLDALPTPVEGQLTSTGANWPAWRPNGVAICFAAPSSQPGCSTLWFATEFPF